MITRGKWKPKHPSAAAVPRLCTTADCATDPSCWWFAARATGFLCPKESVVELPKKVKNLKGQRFGKLTAVQFVGIKREKANWLCVCDCGRTIERNSNELYKAKKLHCGCTPRGSSPTTVEQVQRSSYYSTQVGAIRRGYAFELSFSEYVCIASLPCHYCGAEGTNTRTYRNVTWRYNGIDRVDNDKGYIAGNCLPACFVCNHAKGMMSYDDFLAWLNRAAQHINSKKFGQRNR